jgi:putative hydrolase of the HAD superfamily
MQIGGMKVKAVLFDLDETLLPVDRIYIKGLRAAWGAYRKNSPISWEGFRRRYRDARRNVKKRLGKAPASRSRLLYFKELTECAAGRPQPALALKLMRAYDTAWSSLRLERGRRAAQALAPKYRLGIVTNQVCTMQLQKMSRLDPEGKLFSALVTSEEMGSEKPDGKIFREACRRLRVVPKECVVVGDSWDHDVIGGLRIGARAVFVGAKLPVSKRGVFHIRHIGELPNLLAKEFEA